MLCRRPDIAHEFSVPPPLAMQGWGTVALSDLGEVKTGMTLYYEYRNCLLGYTLNHVPLPLNLGKSWRAIVSWAQ